MKEVIGKLERILELTSTHGICINGTDNATDDSQLDYWEAKVRLNAIQALSLLDKKHTESEKPKRTKVEYVKVTDSIFDLRPDFEAGELYFRWFGNGEEGSGGVGYDKITTESMLLCRYEEGRLLRRIETEIDEREEFIDKACQILDWSIPETLGALYDSVKFKLVD